MISSDIIIRGVREHNLRNVNLRIPRNRLICMTGVSGSGKSSLAFDTLYAEGQRRYVESLSSYARQFLGQMPKPEVDSVSRAGPVDFDPAESQRPQPAEHGRHDHRDLRLPARPLRPRGDRDTAAKCGRQITAQTVEQIIEHVCADSRGNADAALGCR